MKCIEHPDRDATGYVRYARPEGTRAPVTGPYCDPCQVAICTEARQRGNGASAVPLDFPELMAQARRAGVTERIKREIQVNCTEDTPGEVADVLARVVMELETSGAAPGLVNALLDWIQTYQEEARQPNGIRPDWIAPAAYGRCNCAPNMHPAHDLGTGYYCGNSEVREP